MRQINKPFVIIVAVAIVVIALASVGPVVYRLVSDTGVKTEAPDLGSLKPASTPVNGQWTVVAGSGKNSTQVGFTFNEVLPGQRKATSGSTKKVTGQATVTDGKLTSGKVTVDATSLHTDIKKRDISMRTKLLHTDKFPEATFTVDGPVDVSGVSDSGEPTKITIPGTLTLHGVSHQVQPVFTAARTGTRIIMFSAIPVKRLDYGIKTPDFIAAKIAEEGTLDVRLVFEKTSS